MRKAVISVLAVAGLLGAGCGGSSAPGEVPTVPLSTSIEAQTEMRGLQASWAQGSRAERLALEDRLQAFRKRYPKDPLVPVADVMIAWAALERGDLSRALSLAKRVQVQMRGAGTTADLAVMVEGAALRRGGDAAAAFAKLKPLTGKLIDAHARAFLNEEMAAAALGSKRYGEAVDHMVSWLHEAGSEERREVGAKLVDLTAAIPPEALLPILDRRRKAHPEPFDEELEVQRLLAERIANAAESTKDAALAQHLVGSAGALLGPRAEAMADLAGGATGARVEAPTIGLLLPLRNAEARRRGTQVAAGVTHGLGLPGSMARLVSRDDQGRVEGIEEALEGLSADGAAIVVAGVDREEATVAARFAARESIPVVLLQPPAPEVANSPFVFVIGEDPERIRKALVAALPTRGQVLWIGDPGFVDGSRPEAFDCHHVPSAWRGVSGVAVYGGCASEVMMATAGTSVRVAVGLDIDGVDLPKGTLAAAAGAYPVDADAITNDSLRAWMRLHPDPPSYWAGLGRDAAVLSWIGVQVLPPQGTKDPKEVKARRAKAGAALAEAQSDLWTSEGRGFAGGRTLARKVWVKEVRE
ncbi:hypothetical protein [Polyangium aurulentum]|uniref:hypothetical protein n=1 Tax=Polyangium aurulentum TaxID=2567896 RepID=UPI0010ADC727|nr:hypothetical protein [Polyangium aurulentum]UQA61288.1 hypothetical protein E8A73_012740 [Polyangium aurulentum]